MKIEEIREFLISQYRLEELEFKKETKGNKDTKKWTNKAHWLKGRLELMQILFIHCLGYSKGFLIGETLDNWGDFKDD